MALEIFPKRGLKLYYVEMALDFHNVILLQCKMQSELTIVKSVF